MPFHYLLNLKTETMKAISSLKTGFNSALKSLRMVLFIYLSYLAIALLLAIPFYSLFRSAAGNSQLPDSLLNGFDATAIREILMSGGKYFAFYLKAFFPWIIAFLLFQVYLNGGIFSWIANPRGKFPVVLFHQHSSKYFWRFLKLSFYFLIINLIISLILYVPYALITGSKEGLTDAQTMRPFIIVISIHMLLLVFLFLLSDLVKSKIFLQDSRVVLKNMWRCFKLAIRHFFSFYFLGLLCLLLLVAIFAGFYLFRSSVPTDTSGMILLVFLVQQVMIFLQIFLRVWRLGSVIQYQSEIS
jgi:hypothetical protein